ncbi:hypothetical protein HY643_01175 [Candidatus Woesearchaeota archaeon]|nr:hypothetical protein [Candidatus Woesearchaeota archaeon]
MEHPNLGGKKMLTGIIKEAFRETADLFILHHIKNPKKVYPAMARQFTRIGNWEMDPDNEEGNAHKAADSYFLAIHYAEKTGNPQLIQQTKEKTFIFQGYNPLRSKDHFIREIAFEREQRKKIDELTKKAEAYQEKSEYTEAAHTYVQASKIAESINDQKLANQLKNTLKNKKWD